MLEERRDEMILRRAGGAVGPAATGSSPSLLSLRQQTFGGAQPPPLALENQERVPGSGGGGEVGVKATGAAEDGGAVRAEKLGVDNEENKEEEEERRPTVSSEGAEAAVFLGDHEDYYFRAGTLRRRSSMHGWMSDRGVCASLLSVLASVARATLQYPTEQHGLIYVGRRNPNRSLSSSRVPEKKVGACLCERWVGWKKQQERVGMLARMHRGGVQERNFLGLDVSRFRVLRAPASGWLLCLLYKHWVTRVEFPPFVHSS